jgi:hypothetical protein
MLIMSVFIGLALTSLNPAFNGNRTGEGIPVSPGHSNSGDQDQLIEKDDYLGLKVAEFKATGFFRIEKLNDRWFMVTPQGHPFYRIGINGVTPYYGTYRNGAFRSKYRKDLKAWADEVVKRIKAWGFNVIEYKTSPNLIRLMKKGRVERLAYSIVLPFVENVALDRTDFPDVFSEEFKAHAESVARKSTAECDDDPFLIGYFLGNELDLDLSGARKWRSRWVRNLLKGDPDSPAFTAFLEMVKEKYTDAAVFNETHGTRIESLDSLDGEMLADLLKEDRKRFKDDIREYNALLAEKFYEVTTAAVKKYDPNHLILGSRFGGGAEPEVLEKISPYTDVISLNKYTLKSDVLRQLMKDCYSRTGKPLHHSEFSFLERGRTGGSGGAGYPPAESQKARGDLYRKFAEVEITIPYVIGFSWHELFDPMENANFGLVDRNDQVYEDAVSVISETNSKIEHRFAEIIRSLEKQANK